MIFREKKIFALVLALFFVPSFVHAEVIVSGSFESGISPFKSHYGGAEVVSDSTAPNGTHSLRFNFPAGFTGGNSPDIVTPNPENFSSQYEEVYIQFWIKYSSNWVDEPLTNKWVYIWFNNSATGMPNLPIMGHSQYDSNGIWAVLQAGTNGVGEQIWHSYGWGGFTFTYGKWHKVNLHVKMNTGGNSNGILQIWVDDILRINASNGYFRKSSDSYGISSFQMTPVYGGGGTSVPNDQYIWFDDVIIQTTPFGTSSTPTPPSGLSIR